MDPILKDKISNYAGIVLAVCGALIAAQQGGLVLPSWVVPACTVLSAIAGAVIGVLTGKQPKQ